MKLTSHGIAYEVGDRIQANLSVSFRYQCKSGTIKEIGSRPRCHALGTTTGYLIEFDDPKLNDLWLEREHFEGPGKARVYRHPHGLKLAL